MLLLVDIGNTNLKWAFLAGTQLGESAALPHGGELPEVLRSRWRASPSRPSGIWVANVAGRALGEGLSAWADTQWGLTPRFAQSQGEFLGVRSGYRDPGQLGVDRWLAMVAAFDALRRAVLVVDCGTAATLDLIDDGGQHRGGLIVPGLGIMQNALVRGTQLDVDPSLGEPPTLARDTATGIAAGAHQALIGAIERTRSQAGRLLGHTPELILTGGDGPRVHRSLAGRLEPDLVLQGLALLAGRG